MSRREEVTDVAERILESEGPEAVTMRRLAAEMGMRAPSLYKHVAGKDEIHTALQQRALERLTGVLGEAGSDLAAMFHAYRRWALEHPRLYELSARHPLDRQGLDAGVEADAAAPLLTVTGGDIATARVIWALAHGLVDLELSGRFPPDADLDAAWEKAISVCEPQRRPRRDRL